LSVAGCIDNLVGEGHISLTRMWNCYGQAQRFLVTLSTEVATRLQTAAAKGRTITLKVLYLFCLCKTFQQIFNFPTALFAASNAMHYYAHFKTEILSSY